MATEFPSSVFGDTSPTDSTFTMPPMEDPFPAVDYDFNTGHSMPPFSFDSDNDKPARTDPSVMWGGMSQLSLQQPSMDNWAAGGASMSGGLYGHGVSHITQYGQVTPPNDTTPDVDPQLEKSELGPPQQQEESEEATQTKTRKSGTARTKRESATKRKSKTDEPPGSEVPRKKPTKSTRKARKGYKATTKEEEDDSDGEAKREKFLERNRVAASKCRAKKKEWTSGLESQARDLAAQNASLHAYALQLRDEVLWLKGECLRHTDCDCKRIRDYLDRSIAQMNPSGALSGGGGAAGGVLPQPGGSQYRKQSETSVYTFDTGTSVTGGSRQGSLVHESDAGGDGGMSSAAAAPSEQEIQAMLEASIATPAMAESPPSSTGTCGPGTG